MQHKDSPPLLFHSLPTSLIKSMSLILWSKTKSGEAELLLPCLLSHLPVPKDTLTKEKLLLQRRALALFLASYCFISHGEVSQMSDDLMALNKKFEQWIY